MDYLESIVQDVRRRLEQRRQTVPLYRLRAMPAPERRPSFLQAMRSPGLSLIAEVKRTSLSKGPLRSHLDVPDLVARFEVAGAAAISVITEEDHFRGSLDDLAAAVGGSSLPVLQKDFIVDEYQLHEARALGASSVLLIVAVLDHDELMALGETARRLGLAVVAEVHDEVELEQALLLKDAVIGIDNRDMRSPEVSLGTTFRLVSQVPPERLVIGESGVRGREDFLRLEAAGIDGVLVGEHLLVQDDVEAAIRDLLYR